MYPYRNRSRWFIGSRYAHLVHALDKRRRPIQDSTLESRVESIRFWASEGAPAVHDEGEPA